MKHREIALAGCLGAVAGTAVAIVCDWSLLMLLPSALLGALIAFLSYRPQESVTIVREFSRDLKGAMLKFPRIGTEGLVLGIFIVACAITTVASWTLPSTIVFIAGIRVQDAQGADSLLATVLLGGFFCMVIGYGALLIFCLALGELEKHWSMPITRRAHERMNHWAQQWFHIHLDAIDTLQTRGKIFLCCLMAPVLIQVVGNVIAVALIVDAILSILLACATSERMAAILGATLGFCTGTVLHFCSVPSSLAILAVSGIIGWYAGPLLYDLREYLSKAPIVETVSS